MKEMGYVIAFEGNNGLGKTTQSKLLLEWAHRNCLQAARVKGSTSSLIADCFAQARSQHMRTEIQALLLATGTYQSFYSEGLPVLDNGGIVIADRWGYSAIARESVRGLDSNWLRSIYALLPRPDLLIVLQGTPQCALARIQAQRRLGYWEAGQDVHPTLDRTEAFLRFQHDCNALLNTEIERALPPSKVLVLDAALSVGVLHDAICELVHTLLEGKA